MERAVMASGLDWAIVRPTRLTNGLLQGITAACHSSRSLAMWPISSFVKSSAAHTCVKLSAWLGRRAIREVR